MLFRSASNLIDFGDLALLLMKFGSATPGDPSDLDRDGRIGFGDIAVLLLDFGPCG